MKFTCHCCGAFSLEDDIAVHFDELDKTSSVELPQLRALFTLCNGEPNILPFCITWGGG